MTEFLYDICRWLVEEKDVDESKTHIFLSLFFKNISGLKILFNVNCGIFN